MSDHVTIPYGNDEIELTVPESNLIGVFFPNDVEAQDEQVLLEEALNHPIGAVPFDEFLAGKDHILCIINDATRPTPTPKILSAILNHVDPEKLSFLIATGIHRGPNDSELEFIFGEHLELFYDRIFSHDAKDDEYLTELGVSRNGTVMRINRQVLEADAVIPIGSVEPHYFAGYTGGRKSFLPGVAGYDTIEMNHKLALKPEACALALDGNPVHEDMVDAMNTLKDINIFSIQTVIDRRHRIYAVTAGDLQESFTAAIHAAHEVFCVPMPQKADIVVTVAPFPMDVDLYQSQKALDNGKLALAKNGIIILVSQCREGVGHSSFVDVMRSAATPHDVIAAIEKEYKIGYHKAAKMAEIGLWASMWAVTGLKDQLVRAVHMVPKDNVQLAVDEALAQKGTESKIIILPQGSITIPKINPDH